MLKLQKKLYNSDTLYEGSIDFYKNQMGITYDYLYGNHIKGANKIFIYDRYIQWPYQIKNLINFLTTVYKYKDRNKKVIVELITQSPLSNPSNRDPINKKERETQTQKDAFEDIQKHFLELDIEFIWKIPNNSMHARRITTDTGWIIKSDGGLDIYQPPDNNSWSELNAIVVKKIKRFDITYIKMNLI